MLFSFFGRNVCRQLMHQATAPIPSYNIPRFFSQHVATALRSKKAKSNRKQTQYFSDSKQVRTIGGNGGSGCISFLQLWCNENAGPDGGDGGNGGHVIFEASSDVKDFNHVMSILKGDEGEKGSSKDCHGKSANHTVIKVPIGTIIRNSARKIVGDLNKEKLMFVAARGGSGGKGNHFFASDTQQAPQICEHGANGEDLMYKIELRSMAHIGLIGLPNAGKSTFLSAISRARPKVASYPFTTLKPNIGIIQYDDHEQIAVADLPGLIEDSHKNRGLGIQFLKHAERCTALLFVIDVSQEEPWTHYEMLLYELEQYSPLLVKREKIVLANKIDLPGAEENAQLLRERINVPVIATSAKLGTNISKVLENIRLMYDEHKNESEKEDG